MTSRAVTSAGVAALLCAIAGGAMAQAPSRPGIVVIPHPKKDLGKGLVAKIRKQAGV